MSTDIDPADAKTLKYAINEAVSLGIPVVAASGNEGAGTLDIPAAYPHVIAVGATDAQGSPASFSNTGSGLDLVAPGEEIAVAAPGVLCSTGYARVTGTSFAAPGAPAACTSPTSAKVSMATRPEEIRIGWEDTCALSR